MELKENTTFGKLKLWNPTIASLLGIIFTPIFGAILHYINWKQLNNTKMQFVNLASAIAYLPLFLVLFIFLSNYTYASYLDFIPYYFESTVTAFYVFYWLIWHFFAAKQQINLVKHQVYIKRKFWKPFAIVASIPLIIIILIIIFIVENHGQFKI